MMSTHRNTIQAHQRTSVFIAEDETLLAGVLPNILQTISQGRIEVPDKERFPSRR